MLPQLVAAAIWWVWSDEPTLGEQVSMARRIADNLYRPQPEVATTSQACLKLLRPLECGSHLAHAGSVPQPNAESARSLVDTPAHHSDFATVIPNARNRRSRSRRTPTTANHAPDVCLTLPQFFWVSRSFTPQKTFVETRLTIAKKICFTVPRPLVLCGEREAGGMIWRVS